MKKRSKTENLPIAQVRIRARVDVESWGAASERLWADVTENREHYRLDSIPVFADGLAHGDIVAIEDGEDAFISEVICRSGHSTFRLAFKSGLPTDRAMDEFFGPYADLGCRFEGAAFKGVMAIDCPPEADAERVFQMLKKGKRRYGFAFEDAYFHTR